MNLNDRNMLAVRKVAASTMRKVGLLRSDNFEPHLLDWDTLNLHSKEVIKRAKTVIDSTENNMSENDLDDAQSAHYGLLEIYDALELEKDIRTNLGDRSARDTDIKPGRPYGPDTIAPAVDDGRGGFNSSSKEIETTGLTREGRMIDHATVRSAERYDLTPGDYLRAMVLGAKTDAEKRALAEGTDSAGGFTVPTILSAQFIDQMRAQSTAIRAGAITVPLESDNNVIAKVETDPVPAWRMENAAVAESDPTFSSVTFTPRSLGVLIKVSRELLEDSLNISTILPQIMTAAMAEELDKVALFGSGTAPEPKGVVNFTGVQTIAHNAALTSYAPLISARTLIKTSNFNGVSAYVLHPRDEGTLAALADTTGQPLNLPPAISKVPMLTSTSVPDNEGAGTNESTIVTGDFSKLMIGIRHGITIQILKELFQGTGQYGFVAYMRADIAAEYENAFTKITGITP